MTLTALFYILPFCAAVAFGFTTLWELFTIKKRQKATSQNDKTQATVGLVEKLFYPIFSKWAFIFENVQAQAWRSALNRMIAKAALPKPFTAEIFWSFQIFTGILFVGIYTFFGWYLRIFGFDFPWRLAYAALAVLFGLLFPHFWISSIIRSRSQEILRLFPDFVSNLTLSVEAGLDYFAAMVRYLENTDSNPLAREIQKVVGDVRLGSSREAALKDMSQRLGLGPIQNFVAVLVQATRLGTSIGTVLRAQAEKLRRERFEAAERAGAMAAQKLLFPLIFLIMPAVFLLIFGPLIVRLATGGLQSLFM